MKVLIKLAHDFLPIKVEIKVQIRISRLICRGWSLWRLTASDLERRVLLLLVEHPGVSELQIHCMSLQPQALDPEAWASKSLLDLLQHSLLGLFKFLFLLASIFGFHL